MDNPLDEDNTAWRAGLTYDFNAGSLAYLTFSRGYKSGIIPTIAPSSSADFAPTTQERVDAIELGFKAPMLDNRLQLNGAIFHYDYVDKQLRGTIFDDNFGLLATMVNVPESKIKGLELELIAQLTDGLSLSLNGTYIDSEVTDTFVVYNKQLQEADFKGSELPYTPQMQINGSIQYEWPVSDNGMMAFVGGSFSYADDSNATFAVDGAKADQFVVDSYTLLNLQAGLAAADGNWRVTLFGKNVTDEYRWNSVYHGSDTTFRSAGMPAVYGVSLSLRM